MNQAKPADRLLGILGGMSWESTSHLYQLLNRGVAARRGGLHSANLVMRSVDFETIAALQRSDDWAQAGQILGEAGAGLKAAGATALLIAANTMHKVADEVERLSGLPLIHIVDATAEALKKAGVRRAGLLATRYTMEGDFYRERMRERHGIEVLTPGETTRAEVHRVIYEELCRGQICEPSHQFHRRAIAELAGAGAEAVILGCTELCLLLDTQRDGDILPLFDGTALHAQAAIDWLTYDSQG
ncbi:amino acid racemase [Pelomonas sp. V22]|uniref:aspartate/glutamate racemase family protein n=1 Tax=Pelomonas sp. V22 TaxID=2822139 RepID=UPI0024A9400E|nr:amino acid racemase [Pelomonas sp. V22]MDI4634391.1 amino acid racemase [Pelomonas sp. V22]